jgi:transcriptional regulator of acetoin/glycerol metabolism
VELLTTHKGNISEMSRVMGRTRMQIHRWMKRYGIDPEAYRSR